MIGDKARRTIQLAKRIDRLARNVVPVKSKEPMCHLCEGGEFLVGAGRWCSE